MKRLQLLILSVILLPAGLVLANPLLPVPGSPATAVVGADKTISNFTFYNDNEGWSMTFVGLPAGATYETLYDNVGADHTTAEGNPAGSIYQRVTSDINKRAYWLGYIGAPQFLGDLSDATIYSDVYSTANWQTLASAYSDYPGDVYARWVISIDCGNNTYDMFVSTRDASVNLNSFTGWQNFNVLMNENNFIRWPNATCGSNSFAEVLQNYDHVGLYVFSGTDDVNDIDGNAGTWGTVDGYSRLMHYGAYSSDGSDAVWGVDNVHAAGNSVAIDETSFGSLKALFR